MRTKRFSWDSTRSASSLVSATTDTEPTRSPYSESDLENELDTNNGIPARTNCRTAAASASSPSPNPW